MTSRLTLVCHAATAATRRATFPSDESIERVPEPAPARADVFLTAPEPSCHQTAAALGLPAKADDRIRDCDYGSWRGRSLAALTASDPVAVTRWLTDPSAAPHGGESTLDLLARTGAWLDVLPEDSRIIAVTHASVVRAAVVHAILATPPSFWRIDVPPLSRTVLTRHGSAWTLRTLGKAG